MWVRALCDPAQGLERVTEREVERLGEDADALGAMLDGLLQVRVRVRVGVGVRVRVRVRVSVRPEPQPLPEPEPRRTVASGGPSPRSTRRGWPRRASASVRTTRS